MADLRLALATVSFKQVQTYIQRDNIVLQPPLSSIEITNQLECLLVQKFELDGELMKVLVIKHSLYQKINRSGTKDIW